LREFSQIIERLVDIRRFHAALPPAAVALGEQHEFFVLGDNQDQIAIGDGWLQGTNQTIDGTDFRVYVLGVSTLFVEAEVADLLA
jgi:hypothetical protein